MTDISREQIVLAWETWVETRIVSNEMLNDVGLTVLPDFVFPQMMLRLEKRILTQTLEDDTHTIRLAVPATWWDHWKQDHGRKWLGPLFMRRWPPRMIDRVGTVDVTHLLTFPEQTAYPVNLGKPVRVDILGDTIWEPRNQGEH